jgi:SAM-dependent methyltransferase
VRPSIRAFVETCSRTLPLPDPVYEFGSYRAEGQERLADLRPLFPGRPYVGSDAREGPGVDRVLDLHALDLSDDTVGTALVLDTFEHVRYPHRAASELHRVLRPDGVLIVSTVMDYPVHAAPHDYWRFTPQGLEAVLEGFPSVVVESAGAERLPRSVVGVAFATEQPATRVAALREALASWAAAVEPHWKQTVRLVTPPVALLAARRALGMRGL